MSRISTHVLDTALGKPASGIAVELERQADSGEWSAIASQITDQDGRCGQLVPNGEVAKPGVYRLTFQTDRYHATCGVSGLYPSVSVTFRVRQGETHFHIPLLLSPNGYTTYRGS